jgi:hypothetical protein
MRASRSRIVRFCARRFSGSGGLVRVVGLEDIAPPHRYGRVELVIAAGQRGQPVALAEVLQVRALDLDEPDAGHLRPTPRLDRLERPELVGKPVAALRDLLRPDLLDLVPGHHADVPGQRAVLERQLDSRLVQRVEDAADERVGHVEQEPARAREVEPPGEYRRRDRAGRVLEQHAVGVPDVVAGHVPGKLNLSLLPGRQRERHPCPLPSGDCITGRVRPA